MPCRQVHPELLYLGLLLFIRNQPIQMEKPKGIEKIQPASSHLPKGKKVMFGIGINAYRSTSWPQLNNAVRDVEGVANLLLKQYDFDKADLLRNNEATADKIEEALYRLTDSTVLGEHDSLLIYYSGHGHLDKNERGYWVPVDAEKDRISTYIPNSRIRELISDIKCRHILLISDACFSGSLFVRGVRGAQADEVAEEYEKRISRWAFCSGRHDEVVSDGPAGQHSPFTMAILQELGLNTSKKLNIARLADKVIEITRSNYRQMPEANPIQDAGHRGGQFVFTPRTFRREEEPKPRTKPGSEPIVEPKPRVNPKTILLGALVLTALTLLIALIMDVFSSNQPAITQLQLSSQMAITDTIEYGQTKNIQFKLKNVGKTEALLKPVELAGSDISMKTNSYLTIVPGHEKEFSATWKPTLPGLQHTELIFQSENLSAPYRVQVNTYVKEKKETVPDLPIISNPADPGKKKKTSPAKPNTREPVSTSTNTGDSQSATPINEKPAMHTVNTGIPADIKMWLITNDGDRIDAKNGTFEIPILLKGKSVKVYFEKNGKTIGPNRLRIGKDQIIPPSD